MFPSLPLLSCESSVSVKENPNRKKNRIVSLRITVESALIPVRYKNQTEIYRSNVNKKPILYKTCDDTVVTTDMFSSNLW